MEFFFPISFLIFIGIPALSVVATLLILITSLRRRLIPRQSRKELPPSPPPDGTGEL